jgi:murein DD-endopeptidase MepM/ murein hydrolase activator NlpD
MRAGVPQEAPVIKLHLPFTGPVHILQAYAHIWRDAPGQKGEPFGFRYRDGSVFYPATTPPPAIATGDNWHNGIDYGLPLETPLFAPADGTVSFHDHDETGFGRRLDLTHETIRTLYGHLTEWKVEFGQHVRQGQQIALSGGLPEFFGNERPGFSNAAHLHWAVIRISDGHFVNPAWFIQPPMATGAAKQFHPVHFSVTADNDGQPVHIFESPSKTAPHRGQVPGGSTIKCTGWEFGDAKWDPTADGGQWDRRWYLCYRGWVPSARVRGDAPGSTP